MANRNILNNFVLSTPEGLHLFADPGDNLLCIADAQGHKWVVFNDAAAGDPPTWQRNIIRVTCRALGADMDDFPELEPDWMPPPAA